MNYKSATWFPSQSGLARMMMWFFSSSSTQAWGRTPPTINNCGCRHTITVLMYENRSLWRRRSLYKFILWMLILVSFSNDCRDEEVSTQDFKAGIIYTTGCLISSRVWMSLKISTSKSVLLLFYLYCTLQGSVTHDSKTWHPQLSWKWCCCREELSAIHTPS